MYVRSSSYEITWRGLAPRREYRPICSPCSTDSKRKAERSDRLILRNADTGVSKSAETALEKITHRPLRARRRNVLKSGTDTEYAHFDLYTRAGSKTFYCVTPA